MTSPPDDQLAVVQALLRATPSFLAAPIGDSAELARGTVALAGVFCDHFGGGQPGARFAPRQLRYASRRDGRATRRGRSVLDIGDLKVFPLQPSRNAQVLAEQSATIAATGARLLAIGGDYSVTPHLLEGLSRVYPDKTIGLIRVSRRLDFHAPDQPPTRASATTRIRDALAGRNPDSEPGLLLLGAVSPLAAEEVANAAAACVVPMHMIADPASTRVEDSLRDLRTHCDALYLSVDADVLSPPYGETSLPRTGTGLSPERLIALLDRFAAMPLLGADVMGHVPDLDLSGTASTAVIACIVARVTELLLASCNDN